MHWIEAGAPRDGTADPLAHLLWPESEWAFGEPDLIIDIPPQEIPATGVLDYYNVMVDVDLEEDRWVRTSQICSRRPHCAPSHFAQHHPTRCNSGRISAGRR